MARREQEQKPTRNFWDEGAVFILAVALAAMTPLIWLVDKGGNAVTAISDKVLDKLLTPIFGGSKGKRGSKRK